MHGDFDFSVLVDSLPFLWTGLQFTFKLTIVAMLGGIALGTLLALARLSPIAPLAKAATWYVNIMRSIPLVMVILWFYLIVPQGLKAIFGQNIGDIRLTSALVAFALFEAAYYSEIIRAGIQSVSKGQVAAGLARAREIAAAGQPVLVNVWLDRTDFREGSLSM